MGTDVTQEPERSTATPVPAAAAPPAGPPEEELEEISLLELANVLLKRWKLVAGLPLAAAIVAAAVSLLLPAKYTATAAFIPEAESGGLKLPSGLAGLAAQFGVSVPAGAGTSPALYAQIFKSRTLRDEVLQARFPDPRTEAPADSATLLDLLDVEGESLPERLEAGRKVLDDAVSVRVDNETSMVTLSVETRYPELSASVANLFIELVNRFNLETRQSNARERRRFIEERLSEAETELRAAEEALKTFLERNRQWQGSPQLRFEHDRLERQVSLKQAVYTTLSQSYEEARIQEVNDTPVITVVDYAVPPQEKSSPKRKLNVILAFFLGGVLGVFGAFGREFVERARERDEAEFEEFTSRWAAIKAELRSLLMRRRRSAP
jgi:uncharacterized protein involved in exopolysaccharide biosynthesis